MQLMLLANQGMQFCSCQSSFSWKHNLRMNLVVN